MIKKYLLVMVCVSASFLAQAASCNKITPMGETSAAKPIVVTPAQPQFLLKLTSNPTTGYAWSIKEYNSKLITLIRNDFFPPESNCIGASGYEVWVFKANTAAVTDSVTTIIKLQYIRSWEKKPAKIATFTVLIKPH